MTHNPLRKDEVLVEQMARALHGTEDYPHPMRNHQPAPLDSLDCMVAHRSKAYSVLAYMDVLRRESPMQQNDRLRELVLARHTERTWCGAPLEYLGDQMRCGYEERHALHDLYPDLSKRDPLSPPHREEQRHTYQPIGKGMCDADEDDWPCAAVRLATRP